MASQVELVLGAGLLAAVLGAAWLLGHLDRPIAALARGWRRIRPQPPQAVTVPVEQLAADLRRLAAYLETVYDTEQPAKMERVTAATLVVAGEASLDRIVPPEGTAAYVRLIAGAQIARIEDSGHLGYITRPAAFHGIVAAFLESIGLSSRGAPTSEHDAA